MERVCEVGCILIDVVPHGRIKGGHWDQDSTSPYPVLLKDRLTNIALNDTVWILSYPFVIKGDRRFYGLVFIALLSLMEEIDEVLHSRGCQQTHNTVRYRDEVTENNKFSVG
jgi:hypothetical protein